MTERLNELSNNVLITLQSGKKIVDAVTSLRELYLYLFKHSVPLISTTYNYLLVAIQVYLLAILANPKKEINVVYTFTGRVITNYEYIPINRIIGCPN